MSLLHEAVEEKKYDVRMIERNVARNVVHADDVSKAAQSLPDDAENAEYISIESIAKDESGKSTH